MINNSMFCKKHSGTETETNKKHKCTCLIENSIDLDPEFSKIVSDNFKDLI